jgi:hypothetical protein
MSAFRRGLAIDFPRVGETDDGQPPFDARIFAAKLACVVFATTARNLRMNTS